MKRRGFMTVGATLAALGGLAYWQRNSIVRWALTNMSNGVSAKLAPDIGSDVCLLTPEQTSGPYFVKAPLRSEISEGRPGLPLKLAIEVVKMPGCISLEGITVEIWHCDATGFYSGYSQATVRAPFDTLASLVVNHDGTGHILPIESDVFMRGGQITNANGMVEFETVFPGWYDPRVTHIHAKVSKGDETFVTTQLYFPDEMVANIYANHPDYKDFGTCPYNLKNDSALRELADQTGVVLNTKRTQERIIASARFGIA